MKIYGDITEEEYADFCDEMSSRIAAEGEPFLAYFAGFIAIAIVVMLILCVIKSMGFL